MNLFARADPKTAPPAYILGSTLEDHWELHVMTNPIISFLNNSSVNSSIIFAASLYALAMYILCAEVSPVF
jgi:hypothetical protein